MNSPFSAVVVSAGSSSRFHRSGANQPKQFVEWAGRPLFIHTLEALSTIPLKELALVVRNEDEPHIREFLSRATFEFPIHLVHGGTRRQDSVRAGLEALSGCERVMIHDGARPFLSREFLDRLIAESCRFDALIPVLPVVETLKELSAEGRVHKTHDRNRFVRVQTPQVFKFAVIQEVHEKLAESQEEYTDDAMMCESQGIAVHTMAGDPQNIKVTVIEDLKAPRLKDIHA
jgi:2-C-methyl-D-erythritol 4-phosphate cytidylyltransferase